MTSMHAAYSASGSNEGMSHCFSFVSDNLKHTVQMLEGFGDVSNDKHCKLTKSAYQETVKQEVDQEFDEDAVLYEDEEEIPEDSPTVLSVIQKV